MPIYSYILNTGERRYRVQICHRGHRHEKKGFRSREAAKAYERRYMDALDSRLAGTDMAVTVEELAEHWLDHMKPRLKSSTLRDYESSLRLRILPDIGHLKIREVTPLLVQALIDRLARDRSPRTVNKTVAPLRAMFRQAVTWGILTYNPTADVRRVPERRLEVDCLSEEDAARLLEVAGGRDRALIAVALGAGLRQGEILALKWGDIDWFRGLIKVRRSLGGDREFSDTKTAYGRRYVRMPAWLKEDLSVYFADMGRPGPEDLIFPSKEGTPLHPQNFMRRNFVPLLEKAGLRRINFHSLRHTYASILLSKGVDPLYVSRQLGHSTIQITMDLYGHMLHREDAHQDVLDDMFTAYLRRENQANEEGPPKRGLDQVLCWWAQQDSNLRHADYESAALPTELWARSELFLQVNIIAH